MKNPRSEKFISSVNEFLSEFIFAYWKSCSTNHVIIRFIETRKSALNNNFFTGVFLIDLTKALDFIPHDCLVAKLHAY